MRYKPSSRFTSSIPVTLILFELIEVGFLRVAPTSCSLCVTVSRLGNGGGNVGSNLSRLSIDALEGLRSVNDRPDSVDETLGRGVVPSVSSKVSLKPLVLVSISILVKAIDMRIIQLTSLSKFSLFGLVLVGVAGLSSAIALSNTSHALEKSNDT